MTRPGQYIAKANLIAKYILEKQEVSLAKVCIDFNLSPSTIYSYWQVIEYKYPEISLENGIFKVKKKE